MTLRELSQWYLISRYIEKLDLRMEDLQRRIVAAETMLQQIREDIGSISMCYSGMPRGSCRRGPVERYALSMASLAVDLARMREERDRLAAEITARRSDAADALARIEAIIDGLPNDETREIFRLRFVDCLSWKKISEKFGSTEAACKKRIYRLIDRN